MWGDGDGLGKGIRGPVPQVYHPTTVWYSEVCVHFTKTLRYYEGKIIQRKVAHLLYMMQHNFPKLKDGSNNGTVHRKGRKSTPPAP